ncbi:hypothetical protein G6F59_015246 [Rhizopus arrhizus]|nr:hypothetical protein G6F59_015246 [Rhizopus arrhizus]
MIDHAQQLGVDHLALAQRFVQVHRTDHGTDVGLHQGDHRHFQIGHLVGGLGRIQYLEEHHAIHANGCVVLGDHFLAGYVQHLLHHVHVAPHPVDGRDQAVQARGHGVGIAPEALDGPFESLRHHPHCLEQDDHGHEGQYYGKEHGGEHRAFLIYDVQAPA